MRIWGPRLPSSHCPITANHMCGFLQRLSLQFPVRNYEFIFMHSTLPAPLLATWAKEPSRGPRAISALLLMTAELILQSTSCREPATSISHEIIRREDRYSKPWVLTMLWPYYNFLFAVLYKGREGQLVHFQMTCFSSWPLNQFWAGKMRTFHGEWEFMYNPLPNCVNIYEINQEVSNFMVCPDLSPGSPKFQSKGTMPWVLGPMKIFIPYLCFSCL